MWAHMISDESLDELHAAARELGLRWVTFGRDHYDVPDIVWPAACAIAELVDSRVIVRTLRNAGLRVGGKKSDKAWKWREALPPELATEAVSDWLAEVRHRVPLAEVDVLHRPTEHLVLHMLGHADGPELGDLAKSPVPGSLVVETNSNRRWSVELVLPT